LVYALHLAVVSRTILQATRQGISDSGFRFRGAKKEKMQRQTATASELTIQNGHVDTKLRPCLVFKNFHALQ